MEKSELNGRLKIRKVPYKQLMHLTYSPVTKFVSDKIHNMDLTEYDKTVGHNYFYTLDEILTGEEFSGDDLAKIFLQASHHAGHEGLVVSCPELIATKIKALTNHAIWNNCYTTHSEENIGIDKNGEFYKDQQVLITVHGGGLITYEKLNKSIENKTATGSVQHTNPEFQNLLIGELPDGTAVELYTLNELIKATFLPHTFGVVMPYALAKKTKPGPHTKKELVNNPLALSRCARQDYIEYFFDRADEYYIYKNTHKNNMGFLGCYHPFKSKDPKTPEGRFISVNSPRVSLASFTVKNPGRFIAVNKGYTE